VNQIDARGLRDAGLFESALSLPVNYKPDSESRKLAAAYAIETMLSLATGTLDESDLANWIRDRIQPAK